MSNGLGGTIAMILMVLGLVCICGVASAEGLMWTLQSVDVDGIATHPKVAVPGIRYVPNTPENLLVIEGTSLASTGELDNPDGGGFEYYSVWLQADENKGGMQVFSGSWMKNMFWSSYPDVEAGDRVRITGWAAAYNGKSFINDRHDSTGSTMWSIEVLSHGDMPQPETVPLVADCDYFDETREGGGERWQTRWVKLKNVSIVSGTWAAGEEVQIFDGTGSVLMKLADAGDFDDYPEPAGVFDVIGVFDQEDVSSPYTDHYRLWVKKYIYLFPPDLKIYQGTEAGYLDLTWDSVLGRTYKIMESQDMENWSQHGSEIEGDDTTKTVTITPDGDIYYYRLDASYTPPQ